MDITGMNKDEVGLNREAHRWVSVIRPAEATWRQTNKNITNVDHQLRLWCHTLRQPSWWGIQHLDTFGHIQSSHLIKCTAARLRQIASVAISHASTWQHRIGIYAAIFTAIFHIYWELMQTIGPTVWNEMPDDPAAGSEHFRWDFKTK